MKAELYRFLRERLSAPELEQASHRIAKYVAECVRADRAKRDVTKPLTDLLRSLF